MGKIRTGSWTAWTLARSVCRIYAKYGKLDIQNKLGVQFANAFEALAIACAAVSFLDDYVLEIDRTEPSGLEDE